MVLLDAALARTSLGSQSRSNYRNYLRRFYRFAGGWPRLAGAYLLACLVTSWCLVAAMFKLRRGATVTWRSTTYSRPESTTASHTALSHHRVTQALFPGCAIA